MNKKSVHATKVNEKLSKLFDKYSSIITHVTGSRFAFIAAIVVVLIWTVTGPVFNYSERWQLIINTITSIITFLMVFVIQQSQNKDTVALQMKLNELIAANKFASNRLVGAEEMTPEELKTLKDFYTSLAKLTEDNKDKFLSHSLDKKETIKAIKDVQKKEELEAEEKKVQGKE
jgi:low affinity Fe/Cu permease